MSKSMINQIRESLQKDFVNLCPAVKSCFMYMLGGLQSGDWRSTKCTMGTFLAASAARSISAALGILFAVLSWMRVFNDETSPSLQALKILSLFERFDAGSACFKDTAPGIGRAMAERTGLCEGCVQYSLKPASSANRKN